MVQLQVIIFIVVYNIFCSNFSLEFLEDIAPTLAYFPTDEDMGGAASALLRLQDTYALPTEKLARGEIQGVKYSPALSGRIAWFCVADAIL